MNWLPQSSQRYCPAQCCGDRLDAFHTLANAQMESGNYQEFSPLIFCCVKPYGCAATDYRKIPTQRPPPSKRPPPFSAPKVLQRGHISSCNRPERLFLGTCRLTLYEKCSVMVTFLFHQLSCQNELPSNRPPPS